MSMPLTPVSPPQETPALFGLFSAARMLSLSGHAEAGVTYDVVCDSTLRYWPGVCRPAMGGEPVQHTITVTFTGAQSGTDPDITYTIAAQASVDSGPVRVIDVTVDDGAARSVSTGGAVVEVFSGSAAGTHTVGLVDQATGVEAQVQITQESDGSVSPGSATLVVEEPAGGEKLVGEAAVRVAATPFLVYGVETCLLGLSFDEQVQRARQRLALVEQPAVERAFWTGEQGNTPALATSDPEILSDDAVDLVTGLSLAEGWLGNQGSYAGTFHITRAAAAVVDSNGVVSRNGSRAESLLGNVWVFGSGYPRTGPVGSAAPTDSQAWMFVTRQPTVRRSEVFVPGDAEDGTALNPRKNTVFVAAERTYVVDFPCQTAAVLIDLAAS